MDINKKRIGILTYHFANNYGAVLQAFALCTKLNKLGFNAVIIDRVPNKPSIIRKIKNLLKKCTNSYSTKSFSDFRRTFLTAKTPLINSDGEMHILNGTFDAIIVGSDQIWRLDYSTGIGYNYFLDFINDTTRKISYAASFGKEYFIGNSEQIEEVKNLLTQFHAVSVRETSAVAICNDTFNIDATHVLDPTILLTPDDYNSIIECTEGINGKYIAKYFLDENQNKNTIAYKVAEEINGDIKNIYIPVFKSKGIKRLIRIILKYKYPTVGSWVSGIKNAEFVVTDSFHGVALSILFNKQFICIANKQRGVARIESLLNIFGLKNRLVFDDNNFDIKICDILIDYKFVNPVIEREREDSINFLLNSIEKA